MAELGFEVLGVDVDEATEAAEFGDVYFICVGTPQRKDGSSADLRFVDSAVESLLANVTRPCLVVGVPPGVKERTVVEDAMREVYSSAIGRGTPFLITNYSTADLVKVAANSFLATKILHQRDGRGLRGHRERRHDAR
jgi:UDPglucose 6-dehydrogenase